MSPATQKDSPSREGPAKACRPLRGALLIACDRIRPDPNQVRRHVDADAQEELASVKRHGILQPITVRFLGAEEGYQIIVGHRRYKAACAAGLTEIPCWVQSPQGHELLVHQIVENWVRRDMHPYDLADALARLRDENGLSLGKIAAETGKSKSEISKLMALLGLSPDVQKLAREDATGHIGRRRLYALRGLPPEEQLKVICRARKEALTAVEVEELAANGGGPRTCRKGPRRRVGHRRYDTAHATVTFVFHENKEVTSDDILAAIEEVRLQVENALREAARPASTV